MSPLPLPSKPGHIAPGTYQERRSSTPFIGFTADGKRVLDRASSHIHSLPHGVLAEAISRVEFGAPRFAKLVVPLGRIIGKSTCVETGPTDEIVFARRKNRYGYTRFVFDRSPIDCDSVVLVLMPACPGTNDLILITAFIGHGAEPEPWDMKATAASVEYWSHHALVWGSEPIESGTETLSCPSYWLPSCRTSRNRGGRQT